MAYQFYIEPNQAPIAAGDAYPDGTIMRRVQVVFPNGFHWTPLIPSTMKTDADIADWIEKQASLKETEMAANIKTSALKV